MKFKASGFLSEFVLMQGGDHFRTGVSLYPSVFISLILGEQEEGGSTSYVVS